MAVIDQVDDEALAWRQEDIMRHRYVDSCPNARARAMVGDGSLWSADDDDDDDDVNVNVEKGEKEGPTLDMDELRTTGWARAPSGRSDLSFRPSSDLLPIGQMPSTSDVLKLVDDFLNRNGVDDEDVDETEGSS
jgi:hypothetical protein